MGRESDTGLIDTDREKLTESTHPNKEEKRAKSRELQEMLNAYLTKGGKVTKLPDGTAKNGRILYSSGHFSAKKSNRGAKEWK